MMHRIIDVVAVVAFSAWAMPVATGAEAMIASEPASGRPACTVFTDTFQKVGSNWFRVVGDWTVEEGKLIGRGWGGGIDAWIYASPTTVFDHPSGSTSMSSLSRARLRSF